MMPFPRALATELQRHFATSESLFGSCPLGQAIEYGSVLSGAGFTMPDAVVLQDVHWKLLRAARSMMPAADAAGIVVRPDAHTVLACYYGWPGEMVDGWQIKSAGVEVELADGRVRDAEVEERRLLTVLGAARAGGDHDTIVRATRAAAAATETVIDYRAAANRRHEAAADAQSATMGQEPFRLVALFPLTAASPTTTRRDDGEGAEACLHRLWKRAEALPGVVSEARELLDAAHEAYLTAHAHWLRDQPTERARRAASHRSTVAAEYAATLLESLRGEASDAG